MGGDMIGDFLAAREQPAADRGRRRLPEDPQILMSHPGVGLDKWEDLPKAKPVFVGAGAINTFYAWLRLAYGFKDENIKPYNFNSAPFIVNKTFDPAGLPDRRSRTRSRSRAASSPTSSCSPTTATTTYSTLIETRRDIVEKNPDLVQRFVDASAIGWYHYLYGDNSKANEMIKTGQSRYQRRRRSPFRSRR